MRRFMVKIGDTYNKLALVKGFKAKENVYFYCFINLTEDTIFPERFKTPNHALNWLDEYTEKWDFCEKEKQVYDLK